MRSFALCIVLVVAASADLRSDLEDIRKNFPAEQIEIIGQVYAAIDPTIREALQSIQATQLSDIIREVYQDNVLRPLLFYLHYRSVEADQVIIELHSVLKDLTSQMLKEPTVGQLRSSIPQITGDFLADCIVQIEASDFMNSVEEKLETSADFANLAATVKDADFRRLVYQAVNAKDISTSEGIESRGFFKKVWNKIKQHGFGVSVSVPFGK